MRTVQTLEVTSEEAGLRLDRWFKRRFPGLGHGLLEKLLRTGQIRLDGGRTKANARLEAGQVIWIPPLVHSMSTERTRRRNLSNATDEEISALRSAVLHCDDALIVLNKPPGLAVQGGTGTHRHLDAMLDALQFDARERPRLVHRLDKDTSGVLLLARTAAAASTLSRAFRARMIQKIYWAIVVGCPRPAEGRIELSLSKGPSRLGDRVSPDAMGGQKAVTHYRTIDCAGRTAAWLVLEPLTGRTHQLRVHAAALGTPILGDGKYGGGDAFLPGEGLGRGLHLHARAIRVPHPAGGTVEYTAPLPDHMRTTWRFLGLDEPRYEGRLFD